MENAVSRQEPSGCTSSKWLPLAFSSIYEAAWDLQMHRNVSGHNSNPSYDFDWFGDLIGQKPSFVRNYLPSQWRQHRDEFWKSTYFQRYRKNCIQLQHIRLMHLKDVVMTLIWRTFPTDCEWKFCGNCFSSLLTSIRKYLYIFPCN